MKNARHMLLYGIKRGLQLLSPCTIVRIAHLYVLARPFLKTRVKLLLLPLVFALTSCSLSPSARYVRWMDLGPLPTWPAAEIAKARHQPVVLSISATSLLTNTDIFWRVEGEVSLHAYASSRWAMPPPQLLQQRMIDLLSMAGPTLAVGIDTSAPLLYVSLTQFEHRYAANGQSSQGCIAMQVTLLQEHHTVDTLRLVKLLPAPSQNAQGGVLALSAAVDALTKDLMVWLAQRLPATSPANLPSKTDD